MGRETSRPWVKKPKRDGTRARSLSGERAVGCGVSVGRLTAPSAAEELPDFCCQFDLSALCRGGRFVRSGLELLHHAGHGQPLDRRDVFGGPCFFQQGRELSSDSSQREGQAVALRVEVTRWFGGARWDVEVRVLPKQVESEDLGLFSVPGAVELEAEASVGTDFAPTKTEAEGAARDFKRLSDRDVDEFCHGFNTIPAAADLRRPGRRCLALA